MRKLKEINKINVIMNLFNIKKELHYLCYVILTVGGRFTEDMKFVK